MPIDWRDHIVSTTDILRGKPRIKGTRIPVGLVLGYLAAGQTDAEILVEFPDLKKEQIAACLDYARDDLILPERISRSEECRLSPDSTVS